MIQYSEYIKLQKQKELTHKITFIRDTVQSEQLSKCPHLSDQSFKMIGGDHKLNLLPNLINIDSSNLVINLLPTDIQVRTKDHKEGYFDLVCSVNENNKIIAIIHCEMQRAVEPDLVKRSTYYMAQLQKQIKSMLTAEALATGEESADIPIHSIWILEQQSMSSLPSNQYYHKISVSNNAYLHYMFLSHLNKPLDEITTKQEAWLYFFKHFRTLISDTAKLDTLVNNTQTYNIIDAAIKLLTYAKKIEIQSAVDDDDIDDVIEVADLNGQHHGIIIGVLSLGVLILSNIEKNKFDESLHRIKEIFDPNNQIFNEEIIENVKAFALTLQQAIQTKKNEKGSITSNELQEIFTQEFDEGLCKSLINSTNKTSTISVLSLICIISSMSSQMT